MIADEKGKELHDKASKGELLSIEEQEQLESWYAAQDNMELEAIGLVKEGNLPNGLQTQIESAMSQLVNLTNRIQEIAAENKILRTENAALLRQLAQRFGQQTA